MRKKLIALACAGVVLVGCSSASVETEPTETAGPAPVPTMEKASNFCGLFERRKETYKEAMSGESADTMALGELSGWALSLEEEAPDEIRDELDSYLAPIQIVESGESGEIDLMEWTMAANDLNIGCVGDLIDK